MTTIHITQTTLSDGSDVFDVVIADDDGLVVLSAVSERDAEALVEKLTNAINAHTVETVGARLDHRPEFMGDCGWGS